MNKLLPFPVGIRNRGALLAAGALLAVALGMGATFESNLLGAMLKSRTTALAACEQNDVLFPEDVRPAEGKTVMDEWKDRYHRRVGEVIEAHLEELRGQGSCTDGLRSPPSSALESLAEDLSGWRSKGDLSEEDMAAVLIDFHQIYECSLQARSFALTSKVGEDMVSADNGLFVDVKTLWTAVDRERKAIEDELVLSRGALRRALQYLSGRGRLHPLENSLLCFERATLDIRNVLSLAAEASSCLPRVWDARTSLRTLPQTP